MRKIVIIAVISFNIVSVCAQLKYIPTSEINIGKNFKTNTDIIANEYVFSDNIFSWNIDDSAKLLTLQLRGTSKNGNDLNDTGNIQLFDFGTNYIKWNKKLDYTTSNVDQYDNMLIKTTDGKSSRLNSENGENLWQAKNTIYYVNTIQKIGVGYKYSDSNSSNILEGIDLNTGKSMWKREVRRDYGLNDISLLNDSVILVAANGLHAVNLKNGTGWDYDATTGKKDHAGTVGTNIVSFAFSALMGTDFEVYSCHDLYTDVVSNVLVDSTSIYMADQKSIIRIDHNGDVRWKENLPKGLPSKSTLFMKDSLLYMVNLGFAFWNGQSANYGKPFVAGFNTHTGKRVFLTTIDYKKEQINAFNTRQDTLFLLTKSRVYKYSMTNGSELWEQSIKRDSLGELTDFADADVYIKSDSGFINLNLSDSTKVQVFTRKDKLLILNDLLKPDKIMPLNDLYFCYLETEGYKFMENGGITVVIDKNNKQVAELNISKNAILKGQTLYEVQGNSVVTIDIDQVIKNRIQTPAPHQPTSLSKQTSPES